MRIIGLIVSVVCMLGVSTLSVDADDKSPRTVTLFTEINHPYVYYKKNSRELTGIGYDIIQEIIKRTDLNVRIQVSPWLRLIKKQKEDPNSCIFVMNRTPQREDQYLWVGPLIMGGLALYKHQDSDIEIKSLSDIKNYTIVGKVDGIAIKDLDTKYGAKLIKAQTDETAAKMFAQKRADLWASGLKDAPLAARYLNLPQPVLAYKMSESDLSMGCSPDMQQSDYSQLVSAYGQIDDLREQIIASYMSF